MSACNKILLKKFSCHPKGGLASNFISLKIITSLVQVQCKRLTVMLQSVVERINSKVPNVKHKLNLGQVNSGYVALLVEGDVDHGRKSAKPD